MVNRILTTRISTITDASIKATHTRLPAHTQMTGYRNGKERFMRWLTEMLKTSKDGDSLALIQFQSFRVGFTGRVF